MTTFRVSLGFTRLPDRGLPPFGSRVLTGLTDNPAFSTPPVPLPEVSGLLVDFQGKLAAAQDGGRQIMAAKNAARVALVSPLRQLAAYVQTVAGEDLALLLSSGFEAVRQSNAQIALPRPVIAAIENSASRQLALRLRAIPTARAYEVRVSFGAGGWQVAGIFTQSRRIVLQDLTPGTVYNIQARAIGGSTGSSDWSDPVSRMSL